MNNDMSAENLYQNRFNVSIPDELYQTESDQDESGQSDYALPSSEVNIGAMLQTARDTMRERITKAEQDLWEAPIWGRHLSYKDMIQDPADSMLLFEPRTGALRIGDLGQDLDPALGTYYDLPGRTYEAVGGLNENRGERYYVSIDPEKPTAKEKLPIMLEDILEGLETVDRVDRETMQPKDYMSYLGVLDTTKQHALVALHALTFPERSGKFRETVYYQQHRAQAVDLVTKTNRMFYQALLGREFDPELSLHTLAEEATHLMHYLEDHETPANHFKSQEIDHPLVIGLGAFQNAVQHPDADIIIAIPSGGTQVGIATQLAEEILYDRKVDIGLLPLSLHSGSTHLPEHFNIDKAIAYLSDHFNLKGKNVLVTEDNSNTGRTAQTAKEALTAVGAGEVHITITEADVHRVMLKQLSDKKPSQVVNLGHPDFQSTAGIVPILNTTRSGDVQIRKIQANRVLRRSKMQRQQQEQQSTVEPDEELVRQ